MITEREDRSHSLSTSNIEMSFLFGSGKDKRSPSDQAKEQTRAISTQIRQEKRQLTRQIAGSDREIQRLTNDIRKHAMNNNKDALRTLAKGVVKLKHNRSQLYGAIAHLDTIDGAVKNQLSNVRLTGIMQTSGQIAHSLNELIKVEQLQGISVEFSKELMKMGIMSEMISEAVDQAMDNADLEEETDEEIKKILDELITPKIRDLPSVTPSIINPVSVPQEAESEDDDLQTRLQALRD